MYFQIEFSRRQDDLELGYGMENRGIGVRFTAGAGELSVPHRDFRHVRPLYIGYWALFPGK
jgi:hypothetical protein